MKLTKTVLKQVIREVIKEEDDFVLFKKKGPIKDIKQLNKLITTVERKFKQDVDVYFKVKSGRGYVAWDGYVKGKNQFYGFSEGGAHNLYDFSDVIQVEFTRQ